MGDLRAFPRDSTMPNHNTPRLCFIGFGEAGQAIASGLRDTGIETVAAWDVLFPAPEGASLKKAGEAMGARGCQFGRRCGAGRRHHRLGGDGCLNADEYPCRARMRNSGFFSATLTF